ncbi:hypothetical protein ACQ5SA_05370 [Stenotrophomonas indicatrix]|jgi:hypothetical protein|uniref:hypothetical protein n=1 Tax=Stenotrophomonas TaxID=40323 RepID=UPI001DFC6B6A|nr:hypothetical protein [Stenotrophomonas lactitubi]CAH0144129.1 hypothetical protein SRABI35_00356 [Stenotrophomonas lactitubi]
MDMPRLSSPRFRLARVSVVPVLLLALAACAAGESSNSAASSPATTAPAAAATATATPGTAPVSADNGLAALIRASGVTCSNASAGTGCTAGDVDSGDFYDVELSPDCGDQGFFAGVAEAKGVETLDAVPSSGSKATATAKLSKGQLVCVQGIGRTGQNPLFYYVVAIPANTVGKCKDNALCDTYGDRPINNRVATGGEACHAAAPGHYAGNCAQGWVSADVLDVFSNGM